MKINKRILTPIVALILSVILFGYQIPNINAEVLPTTVEFTIAPNGEMIDGAMPVKFLAKTETQPSIELIASNLDSITGSLMVIDDYQSTNNYSETLDVSLTFAEYIIFTGNSSEIGLKIGLDGNGFLYHYAIIGDGAYITLTFDITLNNVSNYVNITYLLDGESYDVRKQKKDDIPNLPLTEPTKYGFIFKGWYLDPEYTTPLSLYDRFEIDSYVYGFFEEKSKITIKFYDGDVLISEATQYESEAVLKPSNPVKSGQVFVGWYLDPNFETRLENEDTFITNTNVYAKFVADTGGIVIPTEENNKTLYLVGAAALLLIVLIASSSTKGKPTKKRGK
ncbi:MAG: InlB B-repeat-containing protein [Nitrososphaeria archaeon]